MKSEISLFLIITFCTASQVFAQMDHSGHDMGKGEVVVPAEKQQLIGVKSEIARVRALNKMIRTVGIVAYDPELYAAQNEYSQARSAKEQAEDTEYSQDADQLAEATRLKLKRLGLSGEQIDALKGGEDSLLIGSTDGMVWIYGKIYESEIPLVRQGQTVHVTSKNLPGKMFMGKIISLDAIIDELTRSLRIRTLVKNENGLLKPNMYVDLVVESPLGMRLSIPEDAVLDTGESRIVFVDKGRGVFEKREVTAGQRVDGLVEILGGLKAGEKVVSSGTFLIDSESKLKSTGGGHIH